MSEQPTDSQVREFWEWYGWKVTRLPIDKSSPHNMTDEYLCRRPDGLILSRFPPLDLNNLFKWAVSKVRKMNRHELLHSWIDDVTLRSEDPALALFWALWQIVEHDKENKHE